MVVKEVIGKIAGARKALAPEEQRTRLYGKFSRECKKLAAQIERSLEHDVLSPDERREARRALVPQIELLREVADVSSARAGGAPLPEGFRPKIIEALDLVIPDRGRSRN